jgi:DNA primase
MATPGSLADHVKQRADMLVVADCYTRLGRSGRQFVGLCPFHRERHPSFFVHPRKKVFHCFGCGAGGDVFALVMRAENCDFRSALKIVEGLSLGDSPRERPAKRAAFSSGRKGRSPFQAAKRPAPHNPKDEPQTSSNGWRGPLPPDCDLSRACEPETFDEPRPFYLVRHE